MNFRQIEAFRAVMQCGSVTEACRLLGRSQPAVSRAVADLERSVGYRLFERINRRMVPTEQAVRLFDEVERAFTGLDRIREAAAEIGGRRRAHLRITAMPAISFSLIPEAIEDLVGLEPDLQIGFEVRSSAWVVESVGARQAEVGISGLPLEHPGLRVEITVDAPCVCVLPKGHPLARRERIRAEDLADEPFVSLGRGFRTRRLIDKAFAACGVQRRMQVETQVSQSLCALVARGLGVAVVEPFTPTGWPAPCFEIRPFQPEVRFAFGVVTAAGLPPSPQARRFIEVFDAVVCRHPAPGVNIRRRSEK